MNNELELLLTELDFLKSELELHINQLDEKISQSLAVEYTYESNRLDGSTLTLPETELAIKIGLMIPGKSMAEYLSAINHYQAIQFIREQASEETTLSEDLIKHIHSILSRGINRDNPGVYRDAPLTGSGLPNPPQPEDLSEMMGNMVYGLKVDGPFMHPVIFAAETHQRLLFLSPFFEANGVCARLLMNHVLLEAGYPLLIISGDDASRQAYLNALMQVHANEDKTAWYRFIAEQLMAGIQSLLNRLNAQQNDIF